ncbi:ribonuclease E activity regulator RraA [Rubellimicrobium roseum]|uniref:4-hydroxy-4-methyl-2-oxoglutarate aldolase n=1 Tax=Rubellimicrobium roseum TaxID=687525 RepID=A0A5C4N6A1_9RHOB|nr:ribonuclease E activity regulator RraA [Rubellimicrobium roseum]TNC61396.1 ribonuclease E activity regulator RraA [Rubellimicrobium roseum]
MTLPPQPPVVTADLYDLHHDRVEVIDLQFRCFGRPASFFGPFATLQVLEDHTPVLEWLSTPGEGRVLAVDAGGSLRVGVMGDRLAGIGVANGWRGIVIAGAVRDSTGIDVLDFGVRALGTTARRGWSPNHSTSGGLLQIGGAEVRNGDWVYADREPLPLG